MAAGRRRTWNSSPHKRTRTTAANFHDDDLNGAGAAAQKRTGRSSDKADPSPCLMSRGRSSKVVDGRGICSHQDPPSKSLSDDCRRRRRHHRCCRRRRRYFRCQPLGCFSRYRRSCRENHVSRNSRFPSLLRHRRRSRHRCSRYRHRRRKHRLYRFLPR